MSYIFAFNQKAALFQYQNSVITPILIYFLIKSFLKDNTFKWYLSDIICCLSLIVVAFGVAELILHKNIFYQKFVFNPYYEKYIREGRIMSTQMHPSVLGTYFLAVIPFAAFLAFNGRYFKERCLGFIAGLASFLGIFLAFARAAFLGTFVFFAFYLGIKNKRAFFIFVGLLSFFFIVSVPLSSRLGFFRRFNFVLTSRYSVHSRQISYRLSRFDTAFRMWKKHPFTGVGLDNFRLLFDRYYIQKDVPYEFKIPDNMYLTIFAEAGLIGMFCFFIFILQTLGRGLLFLKTADSGEDKEFVFILLCGFLGILLDMASYDLFYWYMPLYFFWLYAASIRGHIPFFNSSE